MPTLSPICVSCTRYDGIAEGVGFACQAYPRGIPAIILVSGVDHRKPYNGDGGIVYQPIPATDSEQHETLNPRLWAGDTLDEDVKERLLLIAQRFIETWKTPVDVSDIVLTGSNANYTYTDHSDIDLHVIYDPASSEYPDIIEEFLADKRQLWARDHDITVKGYPVEVYPQTTTEAFYGGGIYSLQAGEWVKRPSNEPPNVDDSEVASKVKALICLIESGTDVHETREKIHQFRLAGLQARGEFSPENLAFKDLRDAGYLQKLADLERAEQNEELSLNAADQRRAFAARAGHPIGGTIRLKFAKLAGHLV